MPDLRRSLSIIIQPRDVALLKDLFESRVMTLAHIADLHFTGNLEAAKKRVQKLKAARILKERCRHANERSVLQLTLRGLSTLRSQDVPGLYAPRTLKTFEKRMRVSELTLRHELEVMDVKTAFVKAFSTCHLYRLLQFSTWPMLYQFSLPRSHSSQIMLKPDGLMRIGNSGHHEKLAQEIFFLELDRSTERLDTLAERMKGYRVFYHSNSFSASYGEAAPMRVLMVLKSRERRDNLAERLLQQPSPPLRQAWLTTLYEIRKDPFEAIWLRPIDYRTEPSMHNKRKIRLLDL